MKKLFFLLSLLSIFLISQSLQSQVPLAPSNLKVQYIFSSAINLIWDDNSSNESGFMLERSLDGNFWSQIKMLMPNVINYADIGLIKHTKYYYRIYAFNASGNSAYSNIINVTPESMFDCSVGTDTLSAPYPFYITYTDSRTQIIYKKSEMTGFCTIGNIWAISFYNKGTSYVTVNNCTIKMKSTIDTVLTKFIDTGLTVVYNNMPLNITPNGWFNIGLNPYFVWDINKNLLIEICYHSTTSASSNINLRGTAASNKVWHRHKDFSNGCTLDSGSVQNIRPNFKMVNIIDGVRKISENTPSDYSIEQNYPNPFNGNTKFKFKIKDYSPVTLSLYDVLGRQEVVIFSEPLAPGEYEKMFSLSEHPLPSGIYYYCFVTNGFVSVKKMVILK
jgi:hypothetical protein